MKTLNEKELNDKHKMKMKRKTKKKGAPALHMWNSLVPAVGVTNRD
jgi:hypothetical protein